jgi:hypothetical protein
MSNALRLPYDLLNGLPAGSASRECLQAPAITRVGRVTFRATMRTKTAYEARLRCSDGLWDAGVGRTDFSVSRSSDARRAQDPFIG